MAVNDLKLRIWCHQWTEMFWKGGKKQHVPVGDRVLCSCLGMCMLLPAYPLMCASLHDCKIHFNLLIHFTWCARAVPSNAVQACGKEEPTGRSWNIATDLLFSLFNRLLMWIWVPTNKQSHTHTHTKQPRWITRTAWVVLGVNFS